MDGKAGSLFDYFRMGGVFMWPLLFFSVATLAIIIERVFYFAAHPLRPASVLEKIRALLASAPAALREKTAETAARDYLDACSGNVGFLAAIASLAPLTGFLGTASGMLDAFRSIADAAEVNAQLVAGGIYEALVTTVFGLVVAIVAAAAHSLFTAAIDRCAARLEIECNRLLLGTVDDLPQTA